jgi:hypothetical protein
MGMDNRAREDFFAEVFYFDAHRLLEAIRQGNLVRVEWQVTRLKATTKFVLKREGQPDGYR